MIICTNESLPLTFLLFAAFYERATQRDEKEILNHNLRWFIKWFMLNLHNYLRNASLCFLLIKIKYFDKGYNPTYICYWQCNYQSSPSFFMINGPKWRSKRKILISAFGRVLRYDEPRCLSYTEFSHHPSTCKSLHIHKFVFEKRKIVFWKHSSSPK